MVGLCVSAALAALLMSAAETPGTLAVASDPPGAAVYVDGQFVGETPLDVRNLPPGDHRVRLVKDGYLENGRIVNVTAGKTGSLQVRLTARNAADALPEGQAGGGISTGSGGGGGSKKWLWIGLAGGGAAAAAVVLATRNHPPKIGTVTATPSTGLLAGSTITVTASASDDDGDSLTYTWDFGDGGTGSGASTTHVYNTAGTFTARVTVSDGKKEVSSSATVTIRSLAGTWRGTLDGIAETLVFTQSAGTVGGTLSDVFGAGTVAGTVTTTSPRVRLTITQPPFNPFVYTADPSADVNTLTGVVNGSGYTNVPVTLTRQ